MRTWRRTLCPRHTRWRRCDALSRSRSCCLCWRSTWALATVLEAPEAEADNRPVPVKGLLDLWPPRLTLRLRELPVKLGNMVRVGGGVGVGLVGDADSERGGWSWRCRALHPRPKTRSVLDAHGTRVRIRSLRRGQQTRHVWSEGGTSGRRCWVGCSIPTPAPEVLGCDAVRLSGQWQAS
jgi:hypothetical protein